MGKLGESGQLTRKGLLSMNGQGALFLVVLGVAGCKPREQPTRVDENVPRSGPSSSGGASRLAPPLPSGLSAPASSAVAAQDGREQRVSDTAWVPAAKRWAVAHGQSISFVDPETGNIQEIAPHAGPISRFGSSPRGDLFAFTAGDAYLGVWRADGTLAGAITSAKTTNTQALALSPDGAFVALQEDESLSVWELATRNQVVKVASPGQVWSIAFHPDGHHLVLVSSGARVFDWKKGQFEGEGHDTGTGGTFATAVSPDGRWVAAAADSGHALQVWQSIPWRSVAVLGGAENCQNHIGLSFSADGRFLQGNSGHVWSRNFELGSWRVARLWKPSSKAEISSTWLSEDGQIGLITEETSSQVVDTKTGAILGSLPGAGSSQLSPDGRWLLHYEDQGFATHETHGMRRTASWNTPP